MFEAILIIWVHLGSHSSEQAISSIRYETVERCELAKVAVESARRMSTLGTHTSAFCIPVPTGPSDGR